ncbi:MAG TPA: ABC transporter permease subunit [Steroidobacteraceae bacterium]|nr:ABC transporter permease subunit [Steroidobacteraceae bacterium]
MNGGNNAFRVTALCIGIALLYLPIVVLIGYSFNASPLVSVWGGFSTVWYTELLRHRSLLDSALLSLEVAATASSAAVVLGTLAAIALVRFARFRGRFLLTGMVTAPLVMPEVITGITQLLLFVSLLQTFSWPHRGFVTIVLAHVTFCIAYVTVTVRSRLQGADRSLEEAAMDLGSGPTRAFLEITLPLIAPAILASWLLSFTLSLDDLVISSFVAGPATNTLPMLIYSTVRLGISPVINALASVIIAIVGTLVIAAGWLMRRADQRRELEMREAERANTAPAVSDTRDRPPLALRSPS